MAEPASELARLKDLLLRPESSQLEQLQRRVGALDERLGTKDRLEQATAEVLVEAFRDAEIRQHNELARAVAPVVVAAIQSEIRNSRDMMVEALYPITGRLVAAAVADAFRSLVININERVDKMMSLRLWRLRLKSWMTGKPLSELLLAETARPKLHRVLFLERGSGTLLASWSEDPASDERADLISGMIAAITEFSSSVFENRSGELRTIDMGASRILLHVSGRAIVAGDFSGPLNPQDEALVHEAFARIAEHHHGGGAVGAGVLQSVADAISDIPPEKKKRSSLGIWLAALLLLAAAGYFGWRAWERSSFETTVRSVLSSQLQSREHMRAYPVSLEVDHGSRRVRIAGLAPAAEDAEAIRVAIERAGAPYGVQADIAIIASQESAARNLAQLRERIADLQTAYAANIQSQTSALRETIASQAQSIVKLGAELAQLVQSAQRQEASAGEIAKRVEDLRAGMQARNDEAQANIERLRKAAEEMPILARDARVTAEFFMRRNAIFFEKDAVLRDRELAEKTIARLAELLRAANLRVRIVGYSSETGAAAANRKLAQERANAVAALLAGHGIDASRVVVATRPAGNSLDDAPDASGHANRRVEFEPVFEGEKSAP